jgi:hypothetical protein
MHTWPHVYITKCIMVQNIFVTKCLLFHIWGTLRNMYKLSQTHGQHPPPHQELVRGHPRQPRCSGPWKLGSWCRRDRDVVLVRCTISLGKPRGVRKLERRRNGEGMRGGRSVYEQPKEGFQVSGRRQKGELTRGLARGTKGELHHDL